MSAHRYIQALRNNAFLQASGLIFMGSMAANVLNYLFNLVMGRLLIPAVFGELVSLLGILLIVSVPATALTTILAHFLARATNDIERAVTFKKARAATYRGALVSFIIMLLASPLLASFFKIELSTMLLFALLIPVTFLGGMTGGLLQGLLGFRTLAFVTSAVALLKLVFSLILVALGFGLNGIILALILSSILGYFYSFRKITEKISLTAIEGDGESIFSGRERYLGTVFLSTLFLAVFVNIDQLLSKHFLGQDAAGAYAALATLGKIVTYGSSSILVVLFPLVSQAETGENKKKLLGLSLLATFSISGAIVLVFSLFPNWIVHTLFGASYADAAPYLPYFAMAMALAALASVFIQYYLAGHHKVFLYPLILAAVLEVGGIYLYHETIFSIVMVSLSTSAALLISLIGIYFIPNETTHHG